MNPLLNTGDYNVEAENACSSLLSQFNTNYIYDLCEYALSVREAPTIIEAPNIVTSAEFTFKELRERFPADVQNINEVRSETYYEIITKVLGFYGAQFNEQDEDLRYALAFNIYFLLACGYINCLTKFFADFIYFNYNDLYDGLNVDADKKTKDSTIVYARRRFRDNPKFGICIANIDKCIDMICGMDIPNEQILKLIFVDQSVVDMVAGAMNMTTNLFDFYKQSLSGLNKPAIIGRIQENLMRAYVRSIQQNV